MLFQTESGRLNSSTLALFLDTQLLQQTITVIVSQLLQRLGRIHDLHATYHDT